MILLTPVQNLGLFCFLLGSVMWMSWGIEETNNRKQKEDNSQ